MRVRRYTYTVVFVLLLTVAGGGWGLTSLRAATLTVTNCSGDATVADTLGFLIAAANSGDTIVYAQDCTTTVTATITVRKNLTIDALSGTPRTVVLDGGGARTILATSLNSANGAITLTLNGLTFQNGQTTGSGGAINNQMGAALTVTNSTFLGNGAARFGGAIFNGGGMLTVTNSTFSGNQVTGAGGYSAGGAIFNSNAGSASITSTTFTGNTANPAPSRSVTQTFGGAIATVHDGARTFTLTNTLIAGNTGGNCQGPDLASTQNPFTSGGHNLIGANSAFSFTECSGPDFTGLTNAANNDQVGTSAAPINPLLGTLANYGGKTQTIPLLPGSPAIDAGGAACPSGVTADQRGIARPVNGVCDIGAFESRGFTLTKGTGDNQTGAVNAAFAQGLQVTIASSNGEPVQNGKVSFTGPVSGAGIQNSPVLATIDGTGNASATVTANATAGGPYTVIASAAGATPTATFSLTNVGAAATFTITGLADPSVAGAAQTITVTAKDAANNTALGYLGTIHFTSNDPQAVLPADYTFTAGDNGVHTFTGGVTLKTAGSNKTVTATDTVTAAVTGISAPVTVNPGATTTLTVSAPASATINVPFNVTVTAKDPFGNTATGYAGTVQFTSTDGAATLPANSTLASGVGTFSVTLKTSGNRTVTATDTVTAAITGTSGQIAVGTGPAASFTLVGPATTVAGQDYTFTVTAKDAFNNTKTDYTGIVRITSTDPNARLPANYTFVAANNGVATLTLTLNSEGGRTITVTDTATPGVTGSLPITVIGPSIFSVNANTYGSTPIGGPTTGGTTITITGYGFAGATVKVGGVVCTNVQINGAGTQITCVTGPRAAGTVDVVVTTATGTATARGGFTYVDPGSVPPPGNRPGSGAPGNTDTAPTARPGTGAPGGPNPAPVGRP